MTAETMHRRVEALQHESATAVLRRKLIEQTRFYQDNQSGAGRDKEVGALEIVLDAHSGRCASCGAEVLALAVVGGLLEGDGLHGASGEIFEPSLHPELVIVESHSSIR